MVNATSQVGSRCGGEGMADVYYAITFPSTVGVRIEATAVADTMIDPILQRVGTSCASTGMLACNDDQRNGTTASRLWIRSGLTAGASCTVIVTVDSFSARAVDAFILTVTAQMPTPVDPCNVGRFDVSQGGTVYHSVLSTRA